MKSPEYFRRMANSYSFQLLACCNHPIPISHSLVRSVHAHMIASGFIPRGHLINSLIDIYCKSSNIRYGRHLFDEISQPDVVARTTLITAYSIAGNRHVAQQLFDETPVSMRDSVFYNAMITAYYRDNDGRAAVELFRDMRRDAFWPDHFTFTSSLAGLRLMGEYVKECQQVHCCVLKSGTGSAASVSNALMTAYMNSTSSPLMPMSSFLGAATKVFNEMPKRDELSLTTIITGHMKHGDLAHAKKFLDLTSENIGVAWNAIISGYVHRGLYQEALGMFRKMFSIGIELDEFTYTSIISACAQAGLYNLGEQVHSYTLRIVAMPAPEFILPVNNALVSLYSKCGKIDRARRVFDEMQIKDLVSWNAILSGYVNAGHIEEAKLLFVEIPKKNRLTWTVMISGLAQNGFGEDGLKLFNRMKSEGIEPCDYAFAGAIISCSVLGSLEHGRQLHAQLLRFGFESSISAGNALITMYARCGALDFAHHLFLTMPSVDSVSWNAMIAALGQHGHGVKAVRIFEEMLENSILPDRISFLTILSACSHGGLVKEGKHYFNTMHACHGILPGEDHFARFIDLLCRAGKFSEAQELMESMPFEPNAPIWEAFLAGCRIHGNIDLGIKAAEKLFELAPHHNGAYILLSNMYAVTGRWDDMAKVRKLMRDRGVKKEPGCSWIEAENKIHVFLVDDAKHPEVEAVYQYLQQLAREMRKLGYVADTSSVLRDIESDQMEQGISVHSEKLAVAFGLLKLPRGATIRVFKNLRICSDCHSVMKYISRIAEREIVVRDCKRFHHFVDGNCSCGDYW